MEVNHRLSMADSVDQTQTPAIESGAICQQNHGRCGIDMEGVYQHHLGQFIRSSTQGGQMRGESLHAPRLPLLASEGINWDDLPITRGRQPITRGRHHIRVPATNPQGQAESLSTMAQPALLPNPFRASYADVTARRPPTPPLHPVEEVYVLPKYLLSPVSERLVALNRPSAHVREEVPLGMWVARAQTQSLAHSRSQSQSKSQSMSPTKSASTAGETRVETPSPTSAELVSIDSPDPVGFSFNLRRGYLQWLIERQTDDALPLAWPVAGEYRLGLGLELETNARTDDAELLASSTAVPTPARSMPAPFRRSSAVSSSASKSRQASNETVSGSSQASGRTLRHDRTAVRPASNRSSRVQTDRLPRGRAGDL